jgi:four helix bundle protein
MEEIEKSNFENLQVRQKSVNLAQSIYILTQTFPKEEIYGLTAQMRRCSVSVSSNIAEGYERNGNKEFIQFISIAIGSLSELKTQLIISERVGFINSKDVIKIKNQITEVHKMLNGLKKSLLKTSNIKLQSSN